MDQLNLGKLFSEESNICESWELLYYWLERKYEIYEQGDRKSKLRFFVNHAAKVAIFHGCVIYNRST